MSPRLFHVPPATLPRIANVRTHSAFRITAPMARAALLFGLAALIAAPRAADAQTAGLRTLTWQSATAGCSAVPMLSSPCITGGYYFM